MRGMAKPERHLWPYSRGWNYYSPQAVPNIPKIPYPNGYPNREGFYQYQGNSEPKDNFFQIRYPEPHRSYHAPCTSVNAYAQGNTSYPQHYMPHNAYPIKHYFHRPVPQDLPKSSIKVNNNPTSYPSCSNNYPVTKDQSNSYHTTWNNASQRQRKSPELDVRRFLATWQEKDDDILDVSSETEDQRPVNNGYDSIPLDCTKRNVLENHCRRNCDGFISGPGSNPTGCVVQPYFIKDPKVPISNGILSGEEINNNIHQRNFSNINNPSYYNQSYHSLPERWKPPHDKMLSCEMSVPHLQQFNHCDINVNPLRNTINYRRQKDTLYDSSIRSQYNFSSSLESEDLFCDINSRNDGQHKQSHFHPNFGDVQHRENDQPYIPNYSHSIHESHVYAEPQVPKDPWEMASQNVTYKSSIKHIDYSNKVPYNKVNSVHNFEQAPSNSKPVSSRPVMYEGAFNIMPTAVDSTITIENSIHYGMSTVQMQNEITAKPLFQSMQSCKEQLHATPKCSLGISKSKNCFFNEEISSEDIDISIACSGDLVDENPVSGSISVISYSRTMKEKSHNLLNKVNKDVCKFPEQCQEPSNPKKNPVIPGNSEHTSETSHGQYDESINVENNNVVTLKDETRSPRECSMQSTVVDLSTLKSSSPLKMSHCEQSASEFSVGQRNHSQETTTIDNSPRCPQLENMRSSSLINNKNPLEDEKSSCDLFGKKDTFEEEAFISNDNLLLLAHCSQEYANQLSKENSSLELNTDKSHGFDSDKNLSHEATTLSIQQNEHEKDKNKCVAEKTYEESKGHDLSESIQSPLDQPVSTDSPLLATERCVGRSLPIIVDEEEEYLLSKHEKNLKSNTHSSILNEGTNTKKSPNKKDFTELSSPSKLPSKESTDINVPSISFSPKSGHPIDSDFLVAQELETTQPLSNNSFSKDTTETFDIKHESSKNKVPDVSVKSPLLFDEKSDVQCNRRTSSEVKEMSCEDPEFSFAISRDSSKDSACLAAVSEVAFESSNSFSHDSQNDENDDPEALLDQDNKDCTSPPGCLDRGSIFDLYSEISSGHNFDEAESIKYLNDSICTSVVEESSKDSSESLNSNFGDPKEQETEHLQEPVICEKNEKSHDSPKHEKLILEELLPNEISKEIDDSQIVMERKIHKLSETGEDSHYSADQTNIKTNDLFEIRNENVKEASTNLPCFNGTLPMLDEPKTLLKHKEHSSIDSLSIVNEFPELSSGDNLNDFTTLPKKCEPINKVVVDTSKFKIDAHKMSAEAMKCFNKFPIVLLERLDEAKYKMLSQGSQPSKLPINSPSKNFRKNKGKSSLDVCDSKKAASDDLLDIETLISKPSALSNTFHKKSPSTVLNPHISETDLTPNISNTTSSSLKYPTNVQEPVQVDTFTSGMSNTTVNLNRFFPKDMEEKKGHPEKNGSGESNVGYNNGKNKSNRALCETVIKCSLRWDKIFQVKSHEEVGQEDMSLDLGPAKVELRMPPESCSSGQWKIVEADNKQPSTSIVQVKRLILKRKSQSEERIPKMVIKKTEGEEYVSYLKKEKRESVLNCGKLKIFYDIPSKPKSLRTSEDLEPGRKLMENRE